MSDSKLWQGRLPWDPLPGEQKRQWSILAILLLLTMIFIWLIENTHVPERDPYANDIPERLAQLIMEREPPPPPPPPEPEPEPQPEQAEPEPEVRQEPERTPERVEQARERAREEISAFEDTLADLRDMAPVVTDQPLRSGGAEETELSRDLLTSRAGTRSGGIAMGSVSSGGGGGGALEGGGVAQVESGIGEGTGVVDRRADGTSRRTEEQIRRTFDRYAGRINALYQRALRENPAMQGTVVLRLEIAPDGSVTDASIRSSELNDAELERRMLLIIRTMDFGELDVDVWRGDYPINFFPG